MDEDVSRQTAFNGRECRFLDNYSPLGPKAKAGSS